MNCDQALEQISAALDDELPDAALAELNAHLNSCPACRALYEDLSAIQSDLLEELEEPPEGFHDRVMAAAAAEPLPKAKKRPVRRRWAAVVAAAAVAALVILPQTDFGGISGGSNGAAPAMADAPAGGGMEAYSMENGASMEDDGFELAGRSMDEMDESAISGDISEHPHEDVTADIYEPMAAAPKDAPTDYDAAAQHNIFPTSGDAAEPAQQRSIIMTVKGDLPAGYAWGEDGTLELPAEELPQLEAALMEAGISYDVEGDAEDEFVLVIRLD